jgi:L-alanine-DL-glutamate epimerase-like enolase superfamily enzyme
MLLLDANNAWTDLFSAVQTVKRLEPFFPAWIEEPFSPDDIDNHARLSSATTIPIATGEIEAGRWRFRSLLEARAAQVLQPDALVCGGITEWRRIAALASAYGVPVCPHAWHDIHVHLVAATPNAPFVEYFVDEDIVCTQPLLTRRMKVEDGHLLLPKDIGLGFDFLENCVDQHAVSRWHTVSH